MDTKAFMFKTPGISDLRTGREWRENPEHAKDLSKPCTQNREKVETHTLISN